VVFGVWLVLLSGGAFLLNPAEHALGYLAYTLALTVGLIAVALAKGEKPRWRWGKE
jgi:hypothetical protein